MSYPPRILAVLPGFIPSTMITVVKPLVALHRRGRVAARIVLEQQAGERDIAWADAIVFCRNTEPRHAPLLAAAVVRGVPLLYDLDDNLLELPADGSGATRQSEPSRQAMLRDYLRAATLVRVYSPPVAERVKELNPRVALTFAPVDLSLVPPDAPRPPGAIRIVYATSRTQDALCEIFLPALERILARCGEQVEMHFWGCRPPQFRAFTNVRYHGLVCGYDRFLRRFARAGYDIGLAPLPDEVFFRSKTNNKFREYGACRIAGIYSRNDVYISCVEHESTGLLVDNSADAWHDAIERLIDGAELRGRIQRQARQFVAEHYSQDKFEEVFLAQLNELLGAAIRPTGRDSHAATNPWSPGPRFPGFWPRLVGQLTRSFRTFAQLQPRQAWTALRWFLHDRFLAAWLRWRL